MARTHLDPACRPASVPGGEPRGKRGDRSTPDLVHLGEGQVQLGERDALAQTVTRDHQASSAERLHRGDDHQRAAGDGVGPVRGQPGHRPQGRSISGGEP